MSDSQTIQSLYFCEKSRKNQFFLHEMLNIGPILAQHWYNIILRNRAVSMPTLGYWLVIRL